MNKPEKKEHIKNVLSLTDSLFNQEAGVRGYNQACDEWEKYYKEREKGYGSLLHNANHDLRILREYVAFKANSLPTEDPTEEEIEEMFEEYIKKWMLMPDNPANRKSFPEDNWYGDDPLRVVVSHVGIHQLRILAQAIHKRIKGEK